METAEALSLVGSGVSSGGVLRNVSGNNVAAAITSTNGTWAAASTSAFSGGVQNTNPDDGLTAVTCLSVTICNAVGYVKDDEKIELKVSHGRDVGLVKVDVNQFEQVIMNLAVNARDAMQGRDGRVTLFARVEQGVPGLAPGAYVCLGLRDTGAGMPPDVLSRAFEPFFTTKGPGSGTGLGLSMVYGIVRNFGGTVTINSVEERGTVVSIFLRQGAPTSKAAPRR